MGDGIFRCPPRLPRSTNQQLILRTLTGTKTGYIYWFNGTDWLLKPVKWWSGTQWIIKPLKFWA